MGLSLLNVISKSNLRVFNPNLLGNILKRQNKLESTRLFCNNMYKKPIDTSKKVIYLFTYAIYLNINVLLKYENFLN